MNILVLLVSLFIFINQTNTNNDHWQSIYTTNDILHINYSKNYVVTETGDSMQFNRQIDLIYYIEDITAAQSVIQSYCNDIRWLAEQGYIYATVIEGDVYKLEYSGPNWYHGPTIDTSFTIVELEYEEY